MTGDIKERVCWICFSNEPFSSYESGTEGSSNASTLTNDDIQKYAKDEWSRPCKCRGSTKWVHQSCLLAWIEVQGSNINLSDPPLQDDSLTSVIPERDQDHSTSSSSSPSLSTRERTPFSYLGFWTAWMQGRRIILKSEKLACPQCRTPYQLSLLRPSYTFRSLHSLYSWLKEKGFLWAITSGLVASTYILLWTHGLFSLYSLMGHDDATTLIFTGSLRNTRPLASSRFLESDTSMPHGPISLASQFIFLIGLPLIPTTLIMTSLSSTLASYSFMSSTSSSLSSSSTRSFGSTLLLLIFSYVFVPRRPRFLIWLMPIAWLSYQRSRFLLMRRLNLLSSSSSRPSNTSGSSGGGLDLHDEEFDNHMMSDSEEDNDTDSSSSISTNQSRSILQTISRSLEGSIDISVSFDQGGNAVTTDSSSETSTTSSLSSSYDALSASASATEEEEDVYPNFRESQPGSQTSSFSSVAGEQPLEGEEGTTRRSTDNSNEGGGAGSSRNATNTTRSNVQFSQIPMRSLIESVTGSLLLPFISSFCGSLLLFLFRPESSSMSVKLPFKSLLGIMPWLSSLPFHTAYHSIGRWLHYSLTTYQRNLFAGSLFILVKDAVFIYYLIQKQRMSKSLQVLNYDEPSSC